MLYPSPTFQHSKICPTSKVVKIHCYMYIREMNYNIILCSSYIIIVVVNNNNASFYIQGVFFPYVLHNTCFALPCVIPESIYTSKWWAKEIPRGGGSKSRQFLSRSWGRGEFSRSVCKGALRKIVEFTL